MFAVAAILRFAFLGRNSIWFDEAVTVLVAQAPWKDVIPLLRFEDAHPPFYYLMMKIWIGLVGTGDVAIRFPSACFSFASVLLTYALMRRISSARISFLSALFMSIAPFEIWSGQTARMYALLEALVLGAALVLLEAVERHRWRFWITYAVLAALMVYTEYLAVLVLAAHGLWVLCYERASVRRWLAATAAAAVAYAPWLPALWQQVVIRAPIMSQIYGDKPAYLKLGDLFGLFAFGGSLFGMPSRFYSTTALHPFAQILILLPFLVLCASGIGALARNKRGLALLGFPPLVSLSAMQVIALVTHTFIARWFSFLGPFYAMFLAEGAVALPRAVRVLSDRAAAVIVGGILVINLTGLERYYFDPAFHPFQWRVAAEAVARGIKPDDLLLFGDRGDEISFGHYFKGRAWTMRLLPQPNFDLLQTLGTRYRRVWLIVAPLPDSNELFRQTVSALNGSFALSQRGLTLPGTYPQLYLFDSRR
jgi:4-amino-4-deoxy-L-arabinose transferase-like glycosyltransferase